MKILKKHEAYRNFNLAVRKNNINLFKSLLSLLCFKHYIIQILSLRSIHFWRLTLKLCSACQVIALGIAGNDNYNLSNNQLSVANVQGLEPSGIPRESKHQEIESVTEPATRCRHVVKWGSWEKLFQNFHRCPCKWNDPAADFLKPISYPFSATRGDNFKYRKSFC